MSDSSDKRIVVGLVLALAVFIFAELIMLGSTKDQKAAAGWVRHTRDVLEKMNDLIAYLTEAETGRRGYVISGQNRYLSHYENRATAAQTALLELRALTGDDQRYLPLCDQLEKLIGERLGVSTNSIKVRQEQGFDPSTQTRFMEQGQQAMEPIRQLITKMATEEKETLKMRREKLEKSAEGTVGFAVLVSLLSLALFSTFLGFFVRANSRRRRAEKALHQTNLELEQRVKDRTGELESSNKSLLTEVAVRRETERALAMSHERTRAVFDAALDGVITMDHEGNIAEFNPAAERIFGYRRSNVVGKPLADVIVPPEFREAHRRGLARYLSTGKAAVLGQRIELKGCRADQSLVAVELSITRMPGDGAVMFAGFVRDITERKRSEELQKEADEKLRKQLARLDLLSRTTRAIGERQDLRSIFQVVVQRLEEDLPIDFGCVCLYDAARESLTVESVGQKGHLLAVEPDIIEQAPIQIDQNGLSRCVRGQLVYEPDISEVQFPFPQRLVRAGLRSLIIAPLLVESSVFGVLVAARREPGSFGSADCEFVRQLSEHVALAAHQAQLHGALQHAYDELRQTQQAAMQQERLRALGQMASGIAHDINNAISPVALYTEALLEKEPDLSSRAREYLGTISRAMEDVAATVARLREFYRHREPQLTLSPLSLNKIALQVAELTRASWSDLPQKRGVVIQMQIEVAPDLPNIMGVESEIREALTNLILNAVDAMPEGGTLTLRGKTDSNAEPRHVLIEVVDTGIGMDEYTRRHCLEPFFTTKGERGTGLGLAMVYGVVQRHSATIEIESQIGKGTIVRLGFRVSSSGMPAPVEPQLAQKVPAPLRVLIVDDDPVLLKSLSDILRGDEHQVVAVSGGQAAIDAFRAGLEQNAPFALVITDLGMPYVDGRKVASAVKGMSQRTPIILLTGWGQRLIAEGDVPPEVDQVLNKPPRLQELREAMVRLCEPAPS